MPRNADRSRSQLTRYRTSSRMLQRGTHMMRNACTRSLNRFLTIAVIIVASAAAAAAQTPPPAGAGQRGGGRGPGTPPLLMTTTAWEDGGVIPDKYTMAAGNAAVSPELKWSQVPAGTQSFVLLMHDPEPVLNKGSKMDITHWLIWNIPGTSTGLAEGVAAGELPDGSRQVSLRSNAYIGPGR